MKESLSFDTIVKNLSSLVSLSAMGSRIPVVPASVLEGIISGKYDTSLTEAEQAVIEAGVPAGSRPWFEGAFLPFYTRFRGAMNNSLGVLERVCEGFFPPESLHRRKGPSKPLRFQYEDARRLTGFTQVKMRPKAATFEAAVETGLALYGTVLAVNIKGLRDAQQPFYVIPMTDIVENLARHIKS